MSAELHLKKILNFSFVKYFSDSECIFIKSVKYKSFNMMKTQH